MEMFEKTFAMFAPFARGEKAAADKPARSPDEVDELKRQMEEMQRRLDRLGRKET
jgi:polyhydroxyalkanoate synthesis regulator protein